MRPTLLEDLIWRQVQLQDHVMREEALYGADSLQAERAVRRLIDFEEDAGSALDAAVLSCPAPVVRVNGSEAIFQEDEAWRKTNW